MKKVSLAVLTALFAACSLPWNTGGRDRETNVSFVLDRNQIRLTSVTIGGHRGDFLLATASPKSAIDPSFASRQHLAPRNVIVRFGERLRIALNPASVPLRNMADATIAADAFANRVVTIDYAKQLLSVRATADTSEMAKYPFAGPPSVPVIVNGVPERAVVDTLLPDTIVIPGAKPGRVTVPVSIGGVAFTSVDARIADVPEIRVGNRLLANFLLTVDYSRRTVALWRDPRAGAVQVGPAIR